MLYVITLHLARTSGYPEGSPRHGYEITAPLDPDGHIDAAAWQDQRDLCRVRRFSVGEPDRHGWLLRRAGGAGGATWFIDYDDSGSDDDEAGYRLDRHRFVVGDYVSIRDGDGHLQPFQIIAVKPRAPVKPVIA
ncbi:hypothetical protein [Bosea sp. 2RAB26]|uniref:hypothetical protein n=1 Tax=Bosea sp. 2RAB26 TaxID=3237476 RepID=UPI003F90CE2D